VGLLTQELNVSGRVATFFENFNINTAGFVIVGLFVATWVVALAIWRYGHIEARWEAAAIEARAERGAVTPAVDPIADHVWAKME